MTGQASGIVSSMPYFLLKKLTCWHFEYYNPSHGSLMYQSGAPALQKFTGFLK